MKRLLTILFSAVLCASVGAQVKNYIFVSGQVGEASYQYKIEDVASHISGGFGAGIHAGYEMRVGAFLLDLGFGFNITHSIVNVGTKQDTLPDMTDDDPISGGDMFDYVYNQNHRHDSYTNLSVQVPVMIGAAAKHFYFLAGAKLDMSLVAVSSAEALVSSEMQYHDLPSPAPVMPNHGAFTDYLVSQKPASVQFKPQVMASAEIGYRFVETASGSGWDVPKEKNYWRVALFVDYGILNMHKKGNNDDISLPQTYSTGEMQNITINHIFSTKAAAESKVNNLMVGIKATYLFQLPEKRGCVICRDAYRGHVSH
ncbi:MAG: hypothetical protein IJ776_06255 [Paludibacteraceae bacterium]|nr:hypothetical protein [Paludibacteraceae bacterium]